MGKGKKKKEKKLFISVFQPKDTWASPHPRINPMLCRESGSPPPPRDRPQG